MTVTLHCGYQGHEVEFDDVLSYECCSVLYYQDASWEFDEGNITLITYPSGRRRRVIDIQGGGAQFGDTEYLVLELIHPLLDLDDVL